MSSPAAAADSSKAYCFHCKESGVVKDAAKVQTKNGRDRIAGICAKCGKAVSQFLRKEATIAAGQSAEPPLKTQAQLDKQAAEVKTGNPDSSVKGAIAAEVDASASRARAAIQ